MSDSLRPINEEQDFAYRERRAKRVEARSRRLQNQMPYQPRHFRRVDSEISEDMISADFDVGPDDTGDASDLHGYA